MEENKYARLIREVHEKWAPEFQAARLEKAEETKRLLNQLNRKWNSRVPLEIK